jgi:asparagine synthase (glutamine-hydrolysing)
VTSPAISSAGAATNLPFLRGYLLDGRLCAAGVLDGEVLDRLLDPQALIRSRDRADVLTAATVEAWVGHWQGRAPDASVRRRA